MWGFGVLNIPNICNSEYPRKLSLITSTLLYVTVFFRWSTRHHLPLWKQNPQARREFLAWSVTEQKTEMEKQRRWKEEGTHSEVEQQETRGGLKVGPGGWVEKTLYLECCEGPNPASHNGEHTRLIIRLICPVLTTGVNPVITKNLNNLLLVEDF